MYNFIIVIGGVPTSSCISGFPSSLSSMENITTTDLEEKIDDFSGGFYLFPEIKFHCEFNITNIRGYFLVDPDVSTSFYFQIWRAEYNLGLSIVRVDQVELNFSINCQGSDDELCYIDYTIPKILKALDEDFIGFHTVDNSLARPLFSSSTSDTELYLLSSNNTDNVLARRRNRKSISYLPQVMGMYVCATYKVNILYRYIYCMCIKFCSFENQME